MTHTQVLLRELAKNGRTTYRELVERYEDQGYSYGGFVAAVTRARRKGLISTAPRDAHGVITKNGHCPCCGRLLEDQNDR